MPEKIERDTTITPVTSYSDLFLDSAWVERQLQAEAVSDTNRQKVRNFYNARNYGFAWFNKEGLTVQAQGFWNAHAGYLERAGDSSIFDRQLHQRMAQLINTDSVLFLSRDTLVQTELELTLHFFNHVQLAYGGRVAPEELQWHIPSRKLDAVAMLDTLLAQKGDTGRHWRPLSSDYHRLEEAIARYSALRSRGGWPMLEPPGNSWRKGDSGRWVSVLKKRLAVEGYLSAADTDSRFTDTLEAVVRKAQQAYGLTMDGVAGPALTAALNVPVEERLRQMLVNLERMKWLPARPANALVANIPEYRLHVYENGKVVMGMDVVVGTAANRTVIFSDELKYVVFSPYWNLPQSIVRNEVLPAMRKNSNYLRRNNMEIVDNSGGLPRIRQLPGPGNALGKVKFIFPNRYSIYFHDTPAKSLFSRTQRAFSHGCIRLEKPYELARYLLGDKPQWDEAAIRSAMNSRTEKWVTLEEPVPVLITYFTSWVDAQGQVHFRDDLYGHDRELASHLFEEAEG